MKDILEDFFKEKAIYNGSLDREIIFENEFDDMIDEIVKLCNSRIVSKRSELLIDFYYRLSQRLDTNLPPISIDKIVDMYEKGNL